MPDTRLIERWLPIAELGIESKRERTPMTPFPAPNRLHVWWARRPLVASRAAMLASLLPADADREKFMHVVGIHGDPVEVRRKIDIAKHTGESLGPNPYGYKRAFTHSPNSGDHDWLRSLTVELPAALSVLDPMAGGGSIPFEAGRLGFGTVANDLNPVASLILVATVDWPRRFGSLLRDEFNSVASEFVALAEPKYGRVFPPEPEGARVEGYLYARTVACPYCAGVVPLSPNWRLAPGTGVALTPHVGDGPGSEGRVCAFSVVSSAREQSEGTVRRGTGACPYPDCGRIIDGDEIKEQAQAGRMGEQLFAVVVKKRVKVLTKTGRTREKWVRGYRPPRPEDDNTAEIRAKLDEKMLEWEAFDIVPSERFPEDSNDDRPIQYGMPLWRDLFSPRQLLCHGTSVEVFREMLEADETSGELTDVRKAAYGYLAFSIDKLLNYNTRMTRWIAQREVITGTFDRHDFSFKWSYAEMAPLVTGAGYDWAIRSIAEAIDELVDLVRPEGAGDALFGEDGAGASAPLITVTCKPGDRLDHIADASIDAVVMDPPYYDNVMYAELSDFFYVWLKRTAGRVFPELFTRHLTDKDNEAVANPARFRGEKGARALAGRHYQRRMAEIFAECRRVLKPDGIMTVMFTHKATGAWDALATGLMESGFAVTASWPVQTEASGSLHIRGKAAANSTVLLACRPRAAAADGEAAFWEDAEPRVVRAVRERMDGFAAAGLSGVDLYLAAFGPALEEFSRHWPLRRGRPRPAPAGRRRRGAGAAEEELDPYAATPEDALDAARREVKNWRLEKLIGDRRAELDPATEFFVLAWDAFRAPVFAYDEALRLARAAGVDLDGEIVGRLADKTGSDLRLRDSAARAAKGALGPPGGARGMIDAVHHAAHAARARSLGAARDLAEAEGLDRDPRFLAALEAVLEVLPPARDWTGIELEGELAAAGSDFAALEGLRRLAFGDRIDAPQQLALWRDGDE